MPLLKNVVQWRKCAREVGAMSRLAKLVFQRVIVVAFFILLQLAVLLATVLWLSEYRRWIQVVSTVPVHPHHRVPSL